MSSLPAHYPLDVARRSAMTARELAYVKRKLEFDAKLLEQGARSGEWDECKHAKRHAEIIRKYLKLHLPGKDNETIRGVE